MSESTSTKKKSKKTERGNALAIFALAVAGCATILGMVAQAIAPTYITEPALQAAVNRAAWAASREFLRNYLIADMESAAQTELDQANIDVQNLVVETCDTLALSLGLDLTDPGDAMIARDYDQYNNPGMEVCTYHLRKLVRVSVTAPVDADGHLETKRAVYENPSLDIVLAIDTSESMSWGWNNEKLLDDRDPSQCNFNSNCSPLEDIKNAAALFTDNLYLPYDRVGIVAFSKDAELMLPMSDDRSAVLNAIDDLRVFEANQSCTYRFEQQKGDRSTYTAQPGDVVNPCRLYHDNISGVGYVAGSYMSFDCPDFYGLTPDASACMTTNTGDGIALSGAILGGDYSSAESYYPHPDGWPEKRDDALHALILLSDGPADSGHDRVGNRLCPPAENNYAWFNNHPLCRDANVLERHCDSASDSNCLNAVYPPSTTSVVDPNLYDADDRARDMFDIVAQNGTVIFTIGIGAEIKKNTASYDVNGRAPGETLLQYGAFGTTSHTVDGVYYYSNNATSLYSNFLNIANQQLARAANDVNPQPTPLPTATDSPSPSPTGTMTETMTSSPTPTITSTPTLTLTHTQTTTKTRTPTITSTATATFTPTPTQSPSPTMTATVTLTATPLSMTFKSLAAQDGWILESSELSTKGGTLNSNGGTFQVGDDKFNRQYRGILSFDTAALPDNAIIQSAVLKIKYSSIAGTNPFSILGTLWMQIKKNSFNTPSLELTDYNAAPSSTAGAGTFSGPVSAWYSATLTSIGRTNLNRTGLTQFRLRFAMDDNNNNIADLIRFNSGNAPTNQPQLIIVYAIP